MSTETKTTFTPGPWTTFYKNKYHEWHVSLPCEDSPMRVALCPDGVPGSTVEECEANAHLIAAAPSMYEALKAAITGLEDTAAQAGLCAIHIGTRHQGDWLRKEVAAVSNPVIERLRAVLAKAEGRA